MNPFDRSIKKQFIDHINTVQSGALLYLDASWEEIGQRLLPELEEFASWEDDKRVLEETVNTLEGRVSELESEIKALEAKLREE